MQDGLAAMCGASPAERAKLGGLPDDARGMLGAQIGAEAKPRYAGTEGVFAGGGR